MIEHHQNHDLAQQCNQLSLTIVNIYCGNYIGRWKGTQPQNRLIYVFKQSEDPSWIEDARQHCELIPGKWLYIPPFYEVTHHQNEGLELVSIHFSLKLYSHIEVMIMHENFFQGNAPDLSQAFRELMTAGGAFGEVCRFQALLWRFLADIQKRSGMKLEDTGSRFSCFFSLFEAFSRSPYIDFSVEEMAAILKMKRETFVKRFSKEVGISPRRFFNRQRATLAARELMEPEVTIREIAHRFGFSSEFYFSRFFYRHFGLSPRDYRRGFKT